MRHLLALPLALLLPLAAQAQDTASQPVPAEREAQIADADVLQPFVASYRVYRGGKHLGEATMQAVRQQGARWRADLVMRGTRGLIGAVGINAEQSSVFDVVDGRYRPVAQATVNKTVFTRKQTVGTYDWNSRQARWQGDVKNDWRRGPRELQDGDMTGLLINLAVIRDAAPGKTLNYRFVDDGRTREHTYVVADELESVRAGELSYNAMRVERVEDDNEETIIWVVRNVPTPIRMLQRENGEDTYDLRLIEYRGID
ncbi:DUF3108 domain-containing protein [Lysobacter sp. GX 14042]|uniref:DUF3108 domain-containing protein n=1 Tax=Lysobacter sp. GX 14042 TaxID=2907155 RepID=UPI001F461754|nr:DUF3108 domain-containing protein [Lysobacter sp. GX 14042]MCE7031851.1 DUF3108 domain-containing protein [Lysobacter sp. GX 14042]